MDAVVAIFAVGLIVALWLSSGRKTSKPSKNKQTGDLSEDPLDRDSWDDEEDYGPSIARPISATLSIQYRDAGGSVTERVVDVNECDIANPSGYLIGYCRTRSAIRTFRLDRVLKATDLETGEVIDNLNKFAEARYLESPRASIDKLLGAYSDALESLFYLGKADGRFTAKEKQVLLGFCQRATGDQRISSADIDRVCREMAVPTKQAFKLRVGRLAKLDETTRTLILSTASDMVATEKSIAVEEAEALAYFEKRLAVLTPA